MLDFVEGRYDVLCATAIIESGLDIPRANTILIDRADMFGLSQLYQLRGRVGRSKERAYCYLLVPPPNAMTDEARARIEALERHTELGSGFQIASLDLELRGAGDLLGAEQSGTVAQVGFELFCQMLDEAVHELRGEPVVHDVDPELVLRRRRASAGGVHLRRRRTPLPLQAARRCRLDRGRAGPRGRDGGSLRPAVRSRRAGSCTSCGSRPSCAGCKALACEASAKGVTLHLREDTPLDHAKVLKLVQPKSSPYRLSPDMRLTRRAKEAEAFTSGLEATDKLLQRARRLPQGGGDLA